MFDVKVQDSLEKSFPDTTFSSEKKKKHTKDWPRGEIQTQKKKEVNREKKIHQQGKLPRIIVHR